MGGLIYKDYVAGCKFKYGNLFVWLGICTLVFALFRILFPGSAGSDTFAGIDESGSMTNMLDMIFILIFMTFVLLAVLSVTIFTNVIMTADEKNMVRTYICGMPVKKNTYIASKYIFLLIDACVFMSLSYVWGIICAAYCLEGFAYDLCQAWMILIIPGMCYALLCASVDLPLYFRFGKAVADKVKLGFLFVIAFGIIGWILFGDMSILEEIDVWDIILSFVKNHSTLLAIVQPFAPIIVLGIYYLSYKISCALCVRKEMV